VLPFLVNEHWRPGLALVESRSGEPLLNSKRKGYSAVTQDAADRFLLRRTVSLRAPNGR
jgi:hypothetical protein